MSALGWLVCPRCGAPLSRRDGALVCPARHSFDIARQGYVNLLGHAAPANADTPAMVAARDRFLGGGHYAPIAAAVARGAAGARRILEVGAGTGHYLAAALDAAPDAEGLATDVSPAAARRAARCHPRAAAVVADTWAGLPLPDGAVDALLCVFAPRNPAEFDRLLAPTGRLVVAVPAAEHLGELRSRHGLLDVPGDKTAAIAAAWPAWSADVEEVRYRLDLTGDQVADLIAMGPNAFHTVPAAPEATGVTVAVDVVTLRR